MLILLSSIYLVKRLVVTAASVATSGPEFDYSVVDDVPVDSETPVVTSPISRICRLSLRRCS